jgi:hypothetical protein
VLVDDGLDEIRRGRLCVFSVHFAHAVTLPLV